MPALGVCFVEDTVVVGQDEPEVLTTHPRVLKK